MIPYFYKIQEISTGRFYVGCQYGKLSDPNKFWVTYFTSCQYIKSKNKNDFRIVHVEIREDAREYERRYLSRMCKVLGREIFQTRFINRNLAPGILFTEDIKARMSASIKKNIETRKQAGKFIPTFKGKIHSEETKRKMSECKKAQYEAGFEHPKGMQNKKHTEEVRIRIAHSGAEHSAMRGKFGSAHPTGNTKWFNNGIKHLRCEKSPGDEWVEGRIFKKRKG